MVLSVIRNLLPQVRYIIPSLDQAITSLSNFLTVVIIAKAIIPEEFGIYILIYTAIMIIAGVQSSLVTGPIRVLGVTIDGNDHSYFSCQLHIQLALSFILAFLFAAVLFLLGYIDSLLVIYSSLCIIFFQFYEFTRAIYLTKFQYKLLLISDLIVHVTKLIVLYVLYLNDLLTLEISFLIISLTSGLSMLVYLRRGVDIRVPRSELINTISSNWKYGKWLLLETLAFLLSSRIYIYLIGLLIGLEMAGVLGATQNLLNTTNVIVMGIMAFAIPVARRELLIDNYSSWRKWLVGVGCMLLLVVSVILFVMTIFSKDLMEGLYGEYYGQYSYLIPLLAIAYAVSAINSVMSGAFRTVEQPEKGAKAKVVSAVLTIVMAYPLLVTWGLIGAIIGLIATQFIWFFVYCVYLVKGSLNDSEIAKSINAARV